MRKQTPAEPAATWDGGRHRRRPPNCRLPPRAPRTTGAGSLASLYPPGHNSPHTSVSDGPHGAGPEQGVRPGPPRVPRFADLAGDTLSHPGPRPTGQQRGLQSGQGPPSLTPACTLPCPCPTGSCLPAVPSLTTHPPSGQNNGIPVKKGHCALSGLSRRAHSPVWGRTHCGKG